ncbi:integral component of membrane [Sergentomyia squamirostris]
MTFLAAFAVFMTLSSSLVVLCEKEHDFRYIAYQDLLPTSSRFTDGNVTSFSRLLFDVARDQVIVGASNLSLLKNRVEVPKKIAILSVGRWMAYGYLLPRRHQPIRNVI